MAVRRAVESVVESVQAAVGGAPPAPAPPTDKQRSMHALQATLPSAEPDHVETTNWGARVADSAQTLRAGARGPALLEDFHLREKVMHFDHEPIPERVVHARGAGAHGHFQPYASLADVTSAHFLADPALPRTPVFVRFSTVLGSRGSADTVRDIRGFSTRFYTAEGNFDLVGNAIPVFFVQDAMQFPDIIHAGKPEPDREIPQAQTAHDNFYDFVSLTPEAIHTVLWVLSDRGIPRSYRMMQGFGVNTFLLVNDAGARHFVKFHWRPLLGVHALAWDEAQKLAGQDPDFHRRDLWDAIAAGSPAEYELGLQLIPEADEHAFPFDLLDDTKIVPEELVPVRWVGKMTLDRNPDEFFPETEQVAFCVQNLVRGIELSDDPVLQGRAFSYLDTQLTRLGGPNFMELPINQPLCPVANHQRNGFMRTRITPGRINYYPNRDDAVRPARPGAGPEGEGGYEHRRARLEGVRERAKGPKFREHYDQASLYYNSLTRAEQHHLAQAAAIELGRCDDARVRTSFVAVLNEVDHALATQVARCVGVATPGPPAHANHGRASPSLSIERSPKTTAATRRVAILVADGFHLPDVTRIQAALTVEGALSFVVGPRRGPIQAGAGAAEGTTVDAVFHFWNARSTYFDAVVVPGGAASATALLAIGEAVGFVLEAYKHCKPIGAVGDGIRLLRTGALPPTLRVAATGAATVVIDHGVVTATDVGAGTGMTGAGAGAGVGKAAGGGVSKAAGGVEPSGEGFVQDLVVCMRQHRFWDRPVDAVAI